MDPLEKKIFNSAKRIVIKVGSALITGKKSTLINKKTLHNIVSEIKLLKNVKKEVLLVSSGALTLGRKHLKLKNINLKVSEKQAIASVGQVLLMNAWKEAFLDHDINCGQILLTHLDAEVRSSTINARNTIESSIKYGIIPVINENDSVATKELRYGDNDQLAARVAQIASANLLILLSDVDGLYTANPSKNKNAKLIKRIYKISKSIEKASENTSSSTAVGGMETKVKAAKIALASGCNMVITKGSKSNFFSSIFKSNKATWFITKTSPKSARKKWISSQITVKGKIKVDKGAENALKEGASLLPSGITSIIGSFEKGDVINVLNKSNVVICIGLSSYPSKDIKKIAGFKSTEIENLLGYHSKDVIIHRDDMVIRK
ncbi:glutamate 5-kinase [Alphaproteobacteria bacterium]|nr:glutamate 5-kinase [Alphaproteobacteria bacterium]